jgi:hypothetical protein
VQDSTSWEAKMPVLGAHATMNLVADDVSRRADQRIGLQPAELPQRLRFMEGKTPILARIATMNLVGRGSDEP